MKGNPHDSLFKEVLGRPAYARAYLTRVLPPELCEVLDFDRIEVVSGEFVDEELRSRHTDLLLYIPRKPRAARSRAAAAASQGDAPSQTGAAGSAAVLVVDGDGARAEGRSHAAATEEPGVLVYMLMEHQSWPDWLMSRRIYRYCDRIWGHWERDHEGCRELPLIIPMVLYHGEGPWSAPRELHGLLAWGNTPADAGLRSLLGPIVPNAGYLLTDLNELAARPGGSDQVALLLKVMRWGRHKDLLDRLGRFADDLEALLEAPEGLKVLRAIGQYIFILRGELTLRRFAASVTQTAGLATGAAIMTLADQFVEKLREETLREGIEQGLKKGIEQGIEQGIEKGRRGAEIRMLTKLLTLRFRGVDERALQLLESSTSAERAEWTERVLVAETIADVFGAAWDDDAR